MSRRSIAVETSGHYFTNGVLTKKTKHIWLALHGYGQTGEYMKEKLNFLDPTDHFVICPEALNSFYWHTNNEPVACWMTKRYRYEEITAFVSFLDKLYDRYCRHVGHNVQIHLIGFSQGCATLWRWIHASQPRFSDLTNWAGWIPEDISYLHLKDYLKKKSIYLHYGDDDKFITEEQVKGLMELISKNKLAVKSSVFKGKHHIPKDEIERFANEVVLS